jgi:hypothetical protein
MFLKIRRRRPRHVPGQTVTAAELAEREKMLVVELHSIEEPLAQIEGVHFNGDGVTPAPNSLPGKDRTTTKRSS